MLWQHSSSVLAVISMSSVCSAAALGVNVVGCVLSAVEPSGEGVGLSVPRVVL